MKHEFKVGDMALIVGADRDIENIGKICGLVELLPPLTPSISVNRNGKSMFHIGPGPAWLVSGGTLSPYGFSIRAEHHLMPLRGDEDPDAHLATSTPRQAVAV